MEHHDMSLSEATAKVIIFCRVRDHHTKSIKLRANCPAEVSLSEARISNAAVCTITAVCLPKGCAIEVKLMENGAECEERLYHEARLSTDLSSVAIAECPSESYFKITLITESDAMQATEFGFYSPGYIHGTESPTNLQLLAERLWVLKQSSMEYFSPWMNIVQSAGTGKSRSVFELADLSGSKLFYICQREPGDDDYPQPTPAAFDLLHDARTYGYGEVGRDADINLYCRYASYFFHAWRYCALGTATDQATRYGWWTDTPLEPLPAGMTTVCSTPKAPRAKLIKDAIFEDASELYGWLVSSVKSFGKSDIRFLNMRDCEDIAEQWLNRKMRDLGLDCTKCDFIMVVDECHHFRAYPIDHRYTVDPLFQLGSAARLLWRLGGVLVTIDTTADVRLIPQEPFYSTGLRVPTATKQMFHTDLLTQGLCYTPAATVGATLSHEHILSTGRPLWQELQLRNADPRWVYDEIREAFMPGICHMPAKDITPLRAAALICSRVNLAPNPWARGLCRELVGNHLAHLDAFDYKTGHSLVSYATDAALAHSVRLLWKRSPALLATAIEGVCPLLADQQLLLGEGSRAELVAQIVLLDVADKLTESQGVYTVGDFLQELLFPKSVKSGVCQVSTRAAPQYASLQDLVQGSGVTHPSCDLLLRGAMNLVQFVKITHKPTLGDLTEYFSRGLGVVAVTDDSAALQLYLPVVLAEDTAHTTVNAQAAEPTKWTAANKAVERHFWGFGPDPMEWGLLAPGSAPLMATTAAAMNPAPVSWNGKNPTYKRMVGQEAFEEHLKRLETRASGAENEVLQVQHYRGLPSLSIHPSRMIVLAFSVAHHTAGTGRYTGACEGDHRSVGGMTAETPYGIIGQHWSHHAQPVVYPLNRESEWVEEWDGEGSDDDESEEGEDRAQDGDRDATLDSGAEEGVESDNSDQSGDKNAAPESQVPRREPYCLAVAVNNAHLLRGAELAEALSHLLRRTDPLDRLTGDVCGAAKKLQLTPRYGTVCGNA